MRADIFRGIRLFFQNDHSALMLYKLSDQISRFAGKDSFHPRRLKFEITILLI